MSVNINGIPIICPEEHNKCQMCGRMNETRPYGPNGIRICYDCGQTIPITVEHNMGIILFGEEGELI